VISTLPYELEPLCATPEKLLEIRGIGEGIARKIVEICRTGTCAERDELLAQFPPTLLEILSVEGVGPKKAKLFHDALGVNTVADLEAAARAGKVRGLARMSEALEEKLIKAIEAHKSRAGRFLLPQGEMAMARLLGLLRSVPGIERLEPA